MTRARSSTVAIRCAWMDPATTQADSLSIGTRLAKRNRRTCSCDAVTDHPTRNPYAQVTEDGKYLLINLFDGYESNGVYTRCCRCSLVPVASPPCGSWMTGGASIRFSAQKARCSIFW